MHIHHVNGGQSSRRWEEFEENTIGKKSVYSGTRLYSKSALCLSVSAITNYLPTYLPYPISTLQHFS